MPVSQYQHQTQIVTLASLPVPGDPKNRGLRKPAGMPVSQYQHQTQIVTLTLASLPVPGGPKNRCLRKLTGRDAGLTIPAPNPDCDTDTGILASARGPQEPRPSQTGRDAGLTIPEPNPDCDTDTGILASARGPKNQGLRKLTGRDAGLTIQAPNPIVTLASLPVPGAPRTEAFANRQGCRSHNTRTKPRL